MAAWRNANFAVYATMGLGISSFYARIPSVREQLGATTEQMGLLLFTMALGSIMGLLAATPTISRFGSRRVATGGLSFMALAFLVAATGVALGAIPLVVVGFVGVGFGNGIADVAVNVNGAANERATGTPLLALYHGFFSVGVVVGAVIGFTAEATGADFLWQTVVVSALILATLLTARRWVLSEAVVDAPAGAGASGEGAKTANRWRIFLEPRTLLLGCIVLGAGLAEGAGMDWIGLVLVDDHGTDAVAGTIAYLAFVVAVALSRFGGTVLIQRLGRVAALRSTAFAALAGVVIVVLADDVVVAGIGIALWGLGAGLGFPVGMSAAADDPATATARVNAVSILGYLAFLAGPPALGVIGDALTLRVALVLVAIGLVVVVLLAGTTRERR